MRQELQSALDLARSLGPAELPRLLGELAEIAATATARLSTPMVERPDELLDVEQTARRMKCSTAFLYHNHENLPFTRQDKVGRKLLFSSAGLDAYLRKAR